MKRTKELLAVLKWLKLNNNQYVYGNNKKPLFDIDAKIEELNTELRVRKFLTDVVMFRYPCSPTIDLDYVELFLTYATKAQIKKLETKYALTFKEKLNIQDLEDYIDDIIVTYTDKRDIGE